MLLPVYRFPEKKKKKKKTYLLIFRNYYFIIWISVEFKLQAHARWSVLQFRVHLSNGTGFLFKFDVLINDYQYVLFLLLFNFSVCDFRRRWVSSDPAAALVLAWKLQDSKGQVWSRCLQCRVCTSICGRYVSVPAYVPGERLFAHLHVWRTPA